MIASFRAGLSHNVTVKEHAVELRNRRVKTMEANCRRVSRLIFWTVKRQLEYGADRSIALADITLRTMALRYGVKSDALFVDYTVQCVKQLALQRGL